MTGKAAAGTFDLKQTMTFYNVDEIRANHGKHFDSLKVVDDIVDDYDTTKRYGGLVPVFNGTPDYRGAFKIFDLRRTKVASFPKGASGAVEWVDLKDDLHLLSVQLMQSGDDYEKWLNRVAAKFANGGWLTCYDYTAKTKKDGIWQAAIAGASLTQPK